MKGLAVILLVMLCSGLHAQDYIAQWSASDESMIGYYEVQDSVIKWQTLAEVAKGKPSYSYTLPYISAYIRVIGRGADDYYSDTKYLAITFTVAVSAAIYRTTSLTWITTSEQNVNYFLIEKTTSGRTSQVTKMMAKGSGSYTYRLYRTVKRYTYRITPIYKDGSKGTITNFK